MEKLNAMSVTVSLDRISGEENYTTDDECDEKTTGKVSRKKIKRKRHVGKRSCSITKDNDGKDLPQESGRQETRNSETLQKKVTRERNPKKTARIDPQADVEGRVMCSMCNKTYKNKHSLANHKSEVHRNKTMELSADESGDDSDTGKFQCPICHKKFKIFEKYQKHCKSIHLEGEMKVNSAETKTSHNPGDKYVKVNKEKIGKKPVKEVITDGEEEMETTCCEKNYQCPYCPESYSRLCHVSRHINLRHLEKAHSVERKGATKLNGGIESEYSESETEGEESMERFQCPVCSRTYKKRRYCIAHWRDKHKSGEESVQIEELFGPKSAGITKVKDEAEGRVKCPACPRSYKKRYYMLEHWRNHHKYDTESMKGEELSRKRNAENTKVQVGKQNLEAQSEDEAEERVKCPACPKTYKQRYYMLEHWRNQHQNDTESMKDKELSRKGNAENTKVQVESEHLEVESEHLEGQNEHLEAQNEHLEAQSESEDEISVERVQCPACPTSFKKRKYFLRHWRKFHKIDKKIVHSDCDESTDDEGDAIDYSCTSCCNSRNLNCRFCQKLYTSFWFLRKHYMNKHKHELQSKLSTSVTASGDQSENLCMHCDKPCSVSFLVNKRIKKERQPQSVRKREDLVKSPLIVDCNVELNCICSCGLIFKKEKQVQAHLEKYGDFHPNKSYETLGEDIHLMRTLTCSFCGRSFQTTSGLLRHLKNLHFIRKSAETDDDIVERSKKRTSSPGGRGSVTDSECDKSSSGNNAKEYLEKRRSDSAGKYSAKFPSVPVETCLSNSVFPDAETIYHMSKNTTVSDEDIVTEILTNSAEKIGPIRLLDAESPKKSIQKFKNFSITVPADMENAVRIVTKKSENKLRKYSNDGNRTPFLSEAFVLKKQSTDDKGMETDEGKSRGCIGASIVTCDKDKVKAVTVGLDDDTSSEGGKSPAQNTPLETVTFNVQKHLNDSPTKYSPFVKLIKVDELKTSQRHVNKYAASKSVSTKSLPSAMPSKAVFSRRKSFDSNKRVRFERDNNSSNKADHPGHVPLDIDEDSPVKELQLQLGQSREEMHENQNESTITDEQQSGGVCEPFDFEMRDLELDNTMEENDTASDIPVDDEPSVLRKEKHSEGNRGPTTRTLRNQQVPKVISPTSSQSLPKSDGLKTGSEPLYNNQKISSSSPSSSQKSLPLECHAKTNNTQSAATCNSDGKLSVAPSSQGSAAVVLGEKRSSPKKTQANLKKTSPKKVSPKKRQCVLRKLLTEVLPDNPFHQQKTPSARGISSCGEENSEQLLRSGKTVSRVSNQGGAARRGSSHLTRPYLKRNTAISKIQAIKSKLQGIKKKSKLHRKKLNILQDNEELKDTDSHMDQNVDESTTANKHELEEERTMRIEDLKRKISFLSHKTNEIHQVPLQEQTKKVDNPAIERSSSSTSTKRKKCKLKASKTKSKLKMTKRRPVSREEVPITPEKNIEDSIHFPQQFGLAGSRVKGQRPFHSIDFKRAQQKELPLVTEVESASTADHSSRDRGVTKHTDTGSERNKPSSRRTRSWSPVKIRTVKSIPNVALNEDVFGSPNEDKQPVRYNVASSKTPVIKLNKLEKEVDGKYLKLLWDAFGKSLQQSTQSKAKGGEIKSVKSKSTDVRRRRSHSADSTLSLEDIDDQISMNTEDVKLSRSRSADREGSSEFLSLKENFELERDNTETALKIDEEMVSSASSIEKKQKMEEEEHLSGSLDQLMEDGKERRRDSFSTNAQDINSEEMSDHQDDEMIDSENEDMEAAAGRDKPLVDVKVDRAMVDKTGVVNNQSQVVFVHENKVVYADASNVVPVDKKELTSLRNQVDEKRLQNLKSRKRKAVEDETDGNVHPLCPPKKDVISPDILNVCADVVHKNTPLKPLKALEVKAVNEDEIVSSTIIENFGKQDMMASLIALMETAEDSDKEAIDFQVIEPSFLIKKDKKIKYSCHKCDIDFNLKTSLKHHKSTCHPEDEFTSFDIDKKSNVVEREIPAAQNLEMVDDLPASDEDTLYSMPLSELREYIGLIWGCDFNAHLTLEKLKLEKTIKVADLTLKRVHKQTWRIMNETHQSVSSTVDVKQQPGNVVNISVEEVPREILEWDYAAQSRYAECVKKGTQTIQENGQENLLVKQCSDEVCAVSEQSPNAEILTEQSPNTEILTGQNPNTEILTGQNPNTEIVTEQSPNIEILTGQNPNTEIVTEQSPNTEILTEQSPNTEILTGQNPNTEILTGQNPNAEMITEHNFNAEIVEDSTHHLNEKQTVNDTEQAAFGESLETTKTKSSHPVSRKKKLRDATIGKESKTKLKISEKSLPTPLTDFERAIMEPKKKRKKLKRKLSAAESERDLGSVSNEDHSKSVHTSVTGSQPKEKPESKTEIGSVVPQSKIVKKILRDKAREEEMEKRNFVPVTDKPLPSLQEILFRIPKTTTPEADTSVEWKSPLQDVGHVQKFRFGAKEKKKMCEPKPTVAYSMGMAGSSTAVAEPSSEKTSLKTQSLQDIYNAILEGIENPQTMEKRSGVLSRPPKNSQLEEPSTSTGIKRAADVYAPTSKRARVESRSSLREEDMTPDSTTPDKYLEQGTSETDTTTQEAVPNEENSISSHSSVVSSNVSSTEGSGVWQENEVSQQPGKTGLVKQGIPKFTSTPLKQGIPNSRKSLCHIPEGTSTTETACSKLELGENPKDNAEIKEDDIKEDSANDKDGGVESMEYEVLQDDMEIQDVAEDEQRCQAKNKDSDAMECNYSDEEKDSTENRDRNDQESEDEDEEKDKGQSEDEDEEDKDQSEEEEEDQDDDAEKSEESESEKETSEESDQESESKDGKDCNISKYTTMEDDADVLNVCASDEESWLDEEEEENKISNDEDEEKEEEEGDVEEKEEDDFSVKEELIKEEAPEDTRSATDTTDGTENVIIRESTVECEDIDFKPNTIMVNLIPKGFCFQFIHYNVCNKPKCTYKHSVPSKEEIFKKGIHEISRLHNKSDKNGAYEIYKKLLELNFHDHIPTKYLMQLLRLAEDDCDINMACDLLSHAEKIKSIEFHSILISMCSLFPAHYEESLWKLFSCVQNFSKCLTNQNVVVLLRAFQENQQWSNLWNIMNYSLRCHGFLPPVYITRSALHAVLENPEICIQEAAQWIQKCDPEQFYNQDVELLSKMADACLHHNLTNAASILRSVANKTQPATIEGNIVDKDSDTSSVNSEDRGFLQESVKSDEHKSFIHRIMGVRFSKNWEYLAQIFLELSNLEQAKDPRFIRAFIDVFTWEKKNPNSLVDSFKEFFEFLNSLFMKEKTEDVLAKMDRSSLAMMGAELVNFCAMSQWWREGLTVIQILHKNNIQYLTRKSPGGALMSTIALDVCLRCKKPYQAVQLLTACQWSCVDGLKIDKPDFKERVVQLNTLVKQFIAVKRPPLALTVICKVLQKAERDKQIDLYNSLIGFGENFRAIIELCMEIGDPHRAYAAFEVFKNGYTSATFDFGMLRRLVTACGESQYSIPGAHSIYNYLTALNVYPAQDIPLDPRPLCVKLTVSMSHVESIILIEDFMLWLYNFLCDWCVQHETCVVPEEYLSVCVRFVDTPGPHQRMMERKLKELKNLMDVKFTPGLQTFLRPPLNDRRGLTLQITSPSVFNYLLTLDKGDRGKCQGFKRGGGGNGGVPKPGPWNRQDVH